MRDRFTIAHELGHYVLHYLYAKQVLKQNLTKVIAQRYGSGREETEANLFAACFLMPEDEYREQFGLLAGSHTDLSEKFGVSTRASRLRASNLNLG
jgi:Zn-dependent peptidase ImmA (M78 family)